MNVHVKVDEDLLKQVMQVTHIQNSQLLVEKALRVMLEPKPAHFSQATSNYHFSESLMALRQQIEAENIDIDVSVFDNDRRSDKEREVSL